MLLLITISAGGWNYLHSPAGVAYYLSSPVLRVQAAVKGNRSHSLCFRGKEARNVELSFLNSAVFNLEVFQFYMHRCVYVSVSHA